MSKKIKTVIILAVFAACMLTAAACAKQSVPEKYAEQGYNVKVTYDGNSGVLEGQVGTQLIDMYKADNYEAGADGKVQIKLAEPTKRGKNSITITKKGYSLLGWYRERQLVTNEQGNPIDDDGVELTYTDGKYFYSDGITEAMPKYAYADPWDFAADVIEYDPSSAELFSMTLYAGWIKYYTFEYYYQVDGEWQLMSTDEFDYKTTNQQDSVTFDKDTIWLPEYVNGAMSYEHSYNNGSKYNFPKIPDSTFDSAYLDEEKTIEITGSFEHRGTVDYATCTTIGRVEKIYFTTTEGVRYKIETAAQLAANVNPQGIYEILSDLDFEDVAWPVGFTTATFKGQIYAESKKTISNVSCSCSASANYGGLFGYIADGAKIENVAFENITVDFKSSNRVMGAEFGLFAGYVSENAEFNGVELGGTLEVRINGRMQPQSSSTINVIANGASDKLTVTAASVDVYIYGTTYDNVEYRYAMAADSVTMDESGNLNFSLGEFKSEISEYKKSFSL